MESICKAYVTYLVLTVGFNIMVYKNVYTGTYSYECYRNIVMKHQNIYPKHFHEGYFPYNGSQLAKSLKNMIKHFVNC